MRRARGERGQILALVGADCQKSVPAGVHGQHRRAVLGGLIHEYDREAA